MWVVDGAAGEGGGQILRTAVGLALASGSSVRITRIRAGRPRPGLMRQHLAAVRAAAELGKASVDGAEVGSTELTFAPTGIFPGRYTFRIGSAGSATLVLQTVLPALLTASAPSELEIEGGTHNPFAPPVDFLERVFLPLVERMGPKVRLELGRFGFVPAGGGVIRCSISPAPALLPLRLPERGELRSITGLARVANLSPSIGKREVAALCEAVGWDPAVGRVETVAADGPGNVLTAELVSEHLTELFTGFGERGVSAEQVARRLAGQVRGYLDAGVPVGPHLADQLLLPLALAGGGSFRTVAPSLHTRTQAALLGQLLGARIAIEEERAGVRVSVG